MDTVVRPETGVHIWAERDPFVLLFHGHVVGRRADGNVAVVVLRPNSPLGAVAPACRSPRCVLANVYDTEPRIDMSRCCGCCRLVGVDVEQWSQSGGMTVWFAWDASHERMTAATEGCVHLRLPETPGKLSK